MDDNFNNDMAPDVQPPQPDVQPTQSAFHQPQPDFQPTQQPYQPPYQPQQQTVIQQPYPVYQQQPVNVNIVNTLPPQYRPLSPWAYFGYSLLVTIPIAGFILLIGLAGGASLGFLNKMLK